MYTFIRFYVIKFLSLFFYTIGDVLSRIPFNCTAFLYQRAMLKSFILDEKIGFKLWKE